MEVQQQQVLFIVCGTSHQAKCIYIYHFYKFTFLFRLIFLKIIFIRYIISYW